MRIKKYENASSPIERLPYIRNYQWRIMPQTDVIYNDYNTGLPVQAGNKVWTDENGNIVTTSNNPNAAADYAVQYGNPMFILDKPEITIEGLGDGKSRGHLTGESFEDRYARELAAPIAKNVDVDNTFKEQALRLHEQSKEKHKADVKAADARANQLTPGVGTFVGIPLTLTAAGIGGATLAPFLVPGTIGGNIIGTTAFGEALNQAMKYGTGKTLGEHAVNAARYLGIPENQWGDFGILMIGDLPFYVTGDLISKQVANTGRTLTKEALDQLALDNTFKGIPINPTTKDLAKTINTEVKNKQFTNLFPGQIGWAPRQTLTGYHASNKPIQEFNYWYPNWAVIEHDAPHGIYFTANETRPSGGFLAKRPYIEQVTSTFNKPMVLVGEISAAGKNATRNSIERQAQSMGADGIIYQGIKDNQLENQTIVKTLNPDLKVNVSEIIENDPYLITKILDKNKIRLRLPTHTKDLPREIVLEPQGNDQYRIHIRTWNGDHIPANLDPKEKQALFESVYNELPEGAEILFPESSADYPATRGTVAALTHLSRDPRFQRGNTTGTLIYTDKNGNLQTFTGNSFIKGEKPLDLLEQSVIRKGINEPEYTYNPKTGEFDISFPRGLRRKWATEARDDVVLYFDSDDYYNHLILSGATPELAWNISAIRAVNAENAQPIVFRNLGNHTYGDSQNIEGQALIRLNQKLNNRAQLISPESIKHTVYHELGGHGSSLNIGAGNVTIPERLSSILTEMYKHNEALRPQLRPFYQAVKDGNFELAKQIAPEDVFKTSSGEIDFKEIQDFIKYMEDNLEYSARGIASNIAEHQGLKGGWNIEQLRKYFTDKSVDNLLKNVWTIIPAGYGISKFNQSNRKGGKLIPRKYK